MTIITVDEFPISQNQKENLVILSQEDFAQAISSYETGQFLLDDKINYLVKPTNHEAQKNELLTKINDDGHLASGNILLYNPLEHRYLPYESMMKKTIEAQMFKFIELCQLMGAKKVSIIMSKQTNDTLSSKASTSIGVSKVSVKAGYVNNIAESVLGEMQAITEFKGNNSPQVEKAYQLMQTRVFDNNEHILSFYQTAKDTSNRMQSQKVTIKLAEDVSKKLQVFASIDAPFLKKSLGEINFERVKNASIITEISCEVLF